MWTMVNWFAGIMQNEGKYDFYLFNLKKMGKFVNHKKEWFAEKLCELGSLVHEFL